MFIPIRGVDLQISETDKEKMFWNEWVWNSHKWIEHHKGYYTCEFCNSTFTNMMPIGDDVKLCKHNPILNNECKCDYILTAEQGHRVIKCLKCGDVKPI